MSAAENDVYVTEAGPDSASATVVFLHGLFGRGRNFTQAAKALEPEVASLLVDLPDHGRSAWTGGVSYEAMADAIAERLREGWGQRLPVHLVGHSMGGKVAMVLALRHPELVSRLVVVDISPTSSRARGSGESGEAGEFVHLLDSLRRLDLTQVHSRQDADDLLREAIGDDRVRGFLLQNLRRTGEGFAWQANLEVLRRDLSTIGDFPASASHATPFDGPVLWLAGERSSYVGPDDEPAMRALFPRTRLVRIKGAGHWVHSEQPQAFASTLGVFLRADDDA